MSDSAPIRILILDDDPKARELAALLGAHGFQVIHSDDGVDAMCHFDREPIDLVIVELLLDHHDGFDTFVRLHSMGTVPKIIVTTRANDRRADVYLKIAGGLGTDESLPKPFTADQLLAAVQRTLDKRTK